MRETGIHAAESRQFGVAIVLFQFGADSDVLPVDARQRNPAGRAEEGGPATVANALFWPGTIWGHACRRRKLG